MPSIPYYNNIELNKNQLQNHRLHVTNTVADISAAVDGQIAYESNGNRTQIFDGALSAWAKIPRLDKVDTVTKQWNFSPDTTTTAPFALGTNALTVLVTGLNADLVDGLHAATAATATTLAARDSNARIKAADPIAADDVVNYGFLQGFVSGSLTPKDAVKVATTTVLAANTRTGNVLTSTALAAFPAVDGVTLVLNDRILVKNEATGANNGIYYLSQVGSAGTQAWKLTRATDADEDIEMTHGVQVFVTSGGTVNGLSGWLLTTPDPITLNTTALTFVQVSGTADINAGNGLIKTGNVLDVVGTTNRILVNADSIDISPNYAGQNTIVTLGTIVGSAIWSATAIGPTKGGTGQTGVTTGALLYGNATDSWAQLLDVATGSALISGGVGVAPSWNKIGLTTHVSGILGLANGGTGANLSLTGGTAQYVKQVTPGGPFSVGTIPSSDLSNLDFVESVLGTSGRITVTAGLNPVVNIDPAWIGQTTITQLGTVTAGTWSATAIGPTKGGTGQTTIVTGDLLYGNATDSWSKLSGVATGNALISGGIGVAPSWNKIGLSTHVSGLLSVTFGGTGANLSLTGPGYLKQAGAGSVISVVSIASSDISNSTFVTSVSGTTNRITSSGALTPVIDISTNYVGQLSITTLGTIAFGTWQANVIQPIYGGTGVSSFIAGDLLIGTGANTWGRLLDVALGNALISGGVGVAPSWGKIGLTTHVSGTLAEGNGGTGKSTYALGEILYSDATNSLTTLPGSITASKRFLTQTGNGTISAAPAWSAIVLGDLPAGLPKSFATLIGNGALTSIVVTHNLGSQAVVVGLRRVSDNVIVFADAAATTTNTVTINFTVAPTTNQYQAIVFAN